jgi:tRNA (cmo5U34)-methyltransferase
MSKHGVFNEDHAKIYDQKNEEFGLGPIRDSMLNIAKTAFSKTIAKGHILCVGAGTGDEIINLSADKQNWCFTIVEPSEAMINICKEKLKAAGLEERCTFHTGYLDTLQDNQSYDAATCILVGHFILSRADRVALYRQIADRLKQGSFLLNAELSVDKKSASYEHTMSLWERMWHWVPQNTDKQTLSKMRENFERNLSLVPPVEIENMLVEAGYAKTAPVFQSLLIHGWVSPKI